MLASIPRRLHPSYLVSNLGKTTLISSNLTRQTSRPMSPPSPSSSRSRLSSYLITPTDLQAALARNPPSRVSTSARTIPLCATWYLPNDPQSRTGQKDFLECRIPSARFFDLDAISDKSSPYPHMLPSPEVFAEAMHELGIHREDEVVVYDSKDLGIFSAPRVGWTFRIMGHDNVRVLNSFKTWVDDNFPLESGEVKEKPGKSDYPVPEMNKEMVISYEELRSLVQDAGKEGADSQVLDARPYKRWTGEAPEPRPGLPSGHMPGSVSVAYSDLVDPELKTLLPKETLRKVFEEKGIDPQKPIVNSCGTGVTAAVIDAALVEADWGHQADRRLYDGSWTEWAQRAKDEKGMIIEGVHYSAKM